MLWAISALLAIGAIVLYLVQPMDWTWWASGVLLVPAGWLLADLMPDSDDDLGSNDTGPVGPP